MTRRVKFSNNLLIGLGEAEMTNEQRRIVAYLDGLQANVNVVCEIQSAVADRRVPEAGQRVV